MGTTTSGIESFEIRRADSSDVDEIALAHRDSIQSIGRAFYDPATVEQWQAGLTSDLYLNAMAAGEVFFIAIGEVDSRRAVLGFASDYRIAGTTHGASVYVRGDAVRRGVGSALLAAAEAHAVASGAAGIEIEASLAGVAFYEANGFVEIGRGQTQLSTGGSIECVFMRKALAPT